MICPQCHVDNQDDAVQCAHCGAPLAVKADNDAAAKDSDSSAPYSVISESLEEVRSMGAVPDVLAAERVMGLGAVSGGEGEHPHRNEALADALPQPAAPAAKPLAADDVPTLGVPSKAELSDKIPVVPAQAPKAQAAAIKDSGSIPTIYDQPEEHGAHRRGQASENAAASGNGAAPKAAGAAAAAEAVSAHPEAKGTSVAEEAAELFEGSALSDLTAPVLDFSGLETIVDSSYVPPVPNRTGDTMEIPVIKEQERAGRSRQFMGVDDPKLDKQRSKEQKKIDRALAKEKKKAARAAKKAAAGAGAAAGAVAVGAAAATTAQAAEAGEAARTAVAPTATAASSASEGRPSQTSKGADAEKSGRGSSAKASERESASPYSDAPEATKRSGAKDTEASAAADSSRGASAGAAASRAASGESFAYASAAPSKEDGTADKPAKGKGKLVAVIVILVAVALAAAVGVTYYLEMWGGKTVPNVVGSPVAQAQAALEEAGFTVALEQQKSDSEEGLVLSQSPDGVRAEEGSAVTLVVAQSRVVPEVKGQAVDAAIAALAAEGYTDVAQTEQKSNEAEGTVLAVSPEAGTKAPSTQQITLTVAVPFTVPDVAGQSGSDAQAALEAEGYEVVVEYKYDDDVPQGDALSTDPEAGTQLNSGSTVTLYLAKSRAAECVAYTQAYFNSTDKFIIGGISYRIDPAKLSVEYIGDHTTRYTVAAIEYGTIFGIVVENNAAGWQNLTGIIRWDMEGNNIASDPDIRRA